MFSNSTISNQVIKRKSEKRKSEKVSDGAEKRKFSSARQLEMDDFKNLLSN